LIDPEQPDDAGAAELQPVGLHAWPPVVVVLTSDMHERGQRGVQAINQTPAN
jgi:hypothetical protein